MYKQRQNIGEKLSSSTRDYETLYSIQITVSYGKISDADLASEPLKSYGLRELTHDDRESFISRIS